MRKHKEYIAFRKYVIFRFKSLKQILKLKIASVNRAIAEMTKAVELASLALKERLLSMNEVRGAMEDQAKKFALKTEMESLDRKLDAVKNEIIEKIEGVKERISNIEIWRAETKGMATQKSLNTVAYGTISAIILALIAAVTGIIALFK